MAISKEAKPLECRGSDIIAGPSGFEPETAGFLSMIVKSPVLYLAELRALL